MLETAQAARRQGRERRAGPRRPSPGEQFYNTSPLDLHASSSTTRPRSPTTCALYIGGFSAGARDVHRQVRLRRPDRPARQGQPPLPGRRSKFAEIDLHPDAVSNLEMGYLYEELIRRFSELSNETAGEHFTPREVIRLMVNLLFIEDDDAAHQAGHRPDAVRPGLRHRRHALGRRGPPARAQPAGPARGLRPGAERRDLRHLPLGHDAQGPGRLPHRLRQLASPRTATRASASTTCSPTRRSGSSGRRSRRRPSRTSTRRKGFAGRFGAGLPRINDGSLPVPPAHDLEDEAAPRRAARGWRSSSTARRCSPARPARASRRSAAGSSRTTGSKPSSRCPTSSSTTPASRPTSGSSPTARRPERRGKVQLVDAREFFVKMRKSLGEKRKEISDDADRRDHPALRRLRRGREGQDLPQRGVRLPADHRRATAAAALGGHRRDDRRSRSAAKAIQKLPEDVQAGPPRAARDASRSAVRDRTRAGQALWDP